MGYGKVGIVVVTYNRLTLLKDVIASLRNQDYASNDIIVVNNGSTDDTLEWLNDQKDLIIINQDNCGGAGGFYTGMKYVAEKHYDYCWIMDDDVVCEKTALSELLVGIQMKDDIGFVCSKVLGLDNCPMNTPVVDSTPSSNGYCDFTDLICNQMIKVKEATFVSVLFPVSVILSIGLPYKEYFIWGDDTEYTMRISRQYNCYMVCKSIVTHCRSIQANLSFEIEKDRRRIKNYYYMFRNQAFNNIKYNSSNRYLQSLSLFKRSICYMTPSGFHKFKILFKAAIDIIKFNPKVGYPLK